MKKVHMKMDINGCLMRSDNEIDGIMTDNSGNELSAPEIRKRLKECLGKGWKYIPVGECDNFDYQTGCMGHNYELCVGCSKEIKENEERICTVNGCICMKCESEEIQVYKVMMEGSNNGYYRKDLEKVLKEIKHDLSESAETAWTIRPEIMKLVKYYNLPDFEGF